MPAKSKAQHRFMAGCAHNPQHMSGKCPPQSVAKEYVHATKSVKSLPERKSSKRK